MYIVYSFNISTKEIVSRGSPYSKREDAVLNLVKEVQQYLMMYKQTNGVMIEDMTKHTAIEGWVIERNQIREDEVYLYKGSIVSVKGWFSTYQQVQMEKVMMFSIMSVPDPVMVQHEVSIIPETPKISRPTIRNEEMFAELILAIKDRREKMD